MIEVRQTVAGVDFNGTANRGLITFLEDVGFENKVDVVPVITSILIEVANAATAEFRFQNPADLAFNPPWKTFTTAALGIGWACGIGGIVVPRNTTGYYNLQVITTGNAGAGTLTVHYYKTVVP